MIKTIGTIVNDGENAGWIFEIYPKDEATLLDSYELSQQPYVAEFTYDAYFRQIWNRMNELYSGKIDAEQFIDAMANTIQDQLTKAYRAALRDSTLDPNLVNGENDFAQSLEETILSEYDYVDKLAADVNLAAQNGTPVTSFQMRAKMWAQRYTQSYGDCLRIVSEIEGGNLQWIFGDAEHCEVCRKLNGIVARASEWNQLNVKPQNPPNPALSKDNGGCEGWLCKCKLVPTDKRRSPNAFTEIMNITLL